MNHIEINIPPAANELMHMLQKHGHSAYVVGGCVRDSIMGRVPHDWDICTSATPDEMLQIFKDKKIIETGLQHGTVTVVVNGEPYEITTYRIDGTYSDGRHPDSVAFTDDLLADLKRRDFTINAMAYNDETGLIDPFGGLDDIECKLIRCVGSPKERFNEDSLRILRAIRFASQLGFTIGLSTDTAIMKQYKDLDRIAMERINNEFCKIVASDTFSSQLILYGDVFAQFILELNDMFKFPQNNPYHEYDVFGHTVSAVSRCESNDLVTRLAVFFHDFWKPHSFQDGEDGIRHFHEHGRFSAELADTIMRRLKFDNETRENVVELVGYHDAVIDCSKKAVKRWLNKIGEVQFRRLLDVRVADIRGQKYVCDKSRIETINNVRVILDEVLQENACFSLKDLAVNGHDLIQLGYRPGKELGCVLQKLLDAVINEETINDRDVLLKIAEMWL